MPTVETVTLPAALRKLASAARRNSVLITAYEAPTLDAAAGELEAMEAALKALLMCRDCNPWDGVLQGEWFELTGRRGISWTTACDMAEAALGRVAPPAEKGV